MPVGRYRQRRAPGKESFQTDRDFLSGVGVHGRILTARPLSTVMTTTANGDPEPSDNCGNSLPNSLLPSIELSKYGAKIIMCGCQWPIPVPRFWSDDHMYPKEPPSLRGS